MLHAEVWLITTWMGVRQRLRDHDWGDERGDAYSTTIMVALAVTIAIAVGTILLIKFTQKANSIDTNTPTPSSVVP
jgi:cell division protein FtsX